ncbi:MAG: hypothetical protein U9N34_08330 [Candidatus Cloacimonadota bacterium]|nr:hypothetical protein [Candidatus Cloacimonadota bacterium]
MLKDENYGLNKKNSFNSILQYNETKIENIKTNKSFEFVSKMPKLELAWIYKSLKYIDANKETDTNITIRKNKQFIKNYYETKYF